MNDLLRQRALDEALKDPGRHLQRIRQKEALLVRHLARSEAQRKLGFPLGSIGVIGGAVLSALALTAAIATPLGWIAAVAAGTTGLFGLTLASTAGRREARARDKLRSLRLSHEGRALDVDALLARMEAARNAMARDYATYEAQVVAQVDRSKHAANAALLSTLRTRQLAWVRRLDEARKTAYDLRLRLVIAAITERVDLRLETLSPSKDTYEDRLARTHFAERDAKDALYRLAAETDALEALEREFAVAT